MDQPSRLLSSHTHRFASPPLSWFYLFLVLFTLKVSLFTFLITSDRSVRWSFELLFFFTFLQLSRGRNNNLSGRVGSIGGGSDRVHGRHPTSLLRGAILHSRPSGSWYLCPNLVQNWGAATKGMTSFGRRWLQPCLLVAPFRQPEGDPSHPIPLREVSWSQLPPPSAERRRPCTSNFTLNLPSPSPSTMVSLYNKWLGYPIFN